MACYVMELLCGPGDQDREDWVDEHRLRFCDDGSVEMLDHSEKTLRSFAAFQAVTPWCLAVLDDARLDPFTYLLTEEAVRLKFVVNTAIDIEGLLGCDFAEHVLPCYEQAIAGLYEDERPRVALEHARDRYLDNRRARDLHIARTLFYELPPCAQEAANAVSQATGWRGLQHEEYNMLTSAPNAARSAADAAGKFAMRNIPDEYGYNDQRRNAYRKGRHDEQAWQLKHIIRALNAVKEGKPWPALS